MSFPRMIKDPSPITVITLTKNRTDQLVACARSVKNQDYPGRVEHLIMGDDSPVLASLEKTLAGINNDILIQNVKLEDDYPGLIPFYAPSRTGVLRNLAIRKAAGRYICQLDDDNTIDADHISSLVETIESEPGIGIAYSWRRLVWEDGTPYLDQAYPWTPVARLAIDKTTLSGYIYNALVHAGIRVPGTNLVRDAILAPNKEPVYTVDTSELMVKKEVHQRFPFTERFTWREMVGDFSDDYAFVKRCHEGGVRFKASEKATLCYTIGGGSIP